MTNPIDISEKSQYQSLSPDVVAAYNAFRTSVNKDYICFAPYTSLFFNMDGGVNPCCFNGTYRYGSYPQQSIKEIWFGEKVGRLKDHIAQNDLKLGCGLCEHFINIESFTAVNATFYDNPPELGTYPVRLEFNLSDKCNLECIMCDYSGSSLIRKNRNKLPPLKEVYDDAFVEQLEEFIPHLKEALFVGGEPFVIDIFYKIWDRIITINPACLISVQTNGTILNKKVKALLERGKFAINVSLDSVHKNTYEAIRRNAIFEKTMENVDYFINYCRDKNTYFYITPCAMRQNRNELEDLVLFANSKNVRLLFKTVLYPGSSSFFGLNSAERKAVLSRMSKILLPENNEIEAANKKEFQSVMHQLQHFFTDKSVKKEWAAFEAEQKIYTRHHMFKDKKKQIAKLGRQNKTKLKIRKKEFLASIRQEEALIRQRKKLEIIKARFELYHYGEKHLLTNWFKKEIKNYCIKLCLIYPLKWHIIKDSVNKLEQFFATYSGQANEEDIITAIYSNVPLESIITSLLNEPVDALYNGYIRIKNS